LHLELFQTMSPDIVVLNGSPENEQGNTAFLSQYLIKGLRDSGREITEIYLYDLKPGFCKGCHNCWKTGSCVYDDEISDVIKKIIKSNLIIWATPLYFCTMTAFTKMVLERVSPIISPFIEKDSHNEDHHYRKDNPSFGLFSTCFYPDIKHFDNLCQLFKDFCLNMNVDYNFELCIPAAPYLISYKDKYEKYFESIYETGKFYGKNNFVSKDLKEKTSEKIVDENDIFKYHNKMY